MLMPARTTSVDSMCKTLDIELNEIPDWNCCSASIGYAGGGELPGLIVSFDDDEVTIDFNHPLAGRNILFDVLVHRVEPVELH